jgi:hypothetical protein
MLLDLLSTYCAIRQLGVLTFIQHTRRSLPSRQLNYCRLPVQLVPSYSRKPELQGLTPYKSAEAVKTGVHKFAVEILLGFGPKKLLFESVSAAPT